ncbi:hypothetical protein KR018_006948, partial [Drosophila ironensis]
CSYFQLFVASALLIALSAADVSHLSKEKIELPFNDLLPPLAEESTSTSTTTTTTVKPSTAPTTLATKPTKKSYYQKPTQLVKEEKPKVNAAKQDIQLLSLDLLPPFEDESVKPAEEVVKTTSGPVVKITPKPVVAATTHAPKPVVPVTVKAVLQATPRPVVLAAPRPVVQAAPRPVVQAPQPQYSVHPAPAVVHSSHLGSSFQSRFSNYFLTSTPRPRRGPLPTITPFPHFVRI